MKDLKRLLANKLKIESLTLVPDMATSLFVSNSPDEVKLDPLFVEILMTHLYHMHITQLKVI